MQILLNLIINVQLYYQYQNIVYPPAALDFLTTAVDT